MLYLYTLVPEVPCAALYAFKVSRSQKVSCDGMGFTTNFRHTHPHTQTHTHTCAHTHTHREEAHETYHIHPGIKRLTQTHRNIY